MVNFYDRVLEHPEFYRQFSCGSSLITAFNCPMEARLMQNRFADLWTQYNYLFYVIDGRKIWHTSQGTYDIQRDSCVFVRKGGFILEQIADTGFCVLLFFIPDEFICDTLRNAENFNQPPQQQYEPLMLLDTSETLAGFFYSMSSYFAQTQDPDKALLELKFRELILNIAHNPKNEALRSYFCSLLHEPQSNALLRTMEDNYCFNLSLEVYAKLCNRSLSAFKRDFQKHFNTTPGKWLLEKRLLHAQNLLINLGKNTSEAAFESGFESSAHFSRSYKQRFGIAPSAAKQLAEESR
ncbi:MAG: AraC family transcriptional regulator [Chitinophagaceae bacterium]